MVNVSAPILDMSDTAARMMCPVCAATYETEQTFCSRDGAALRPVVDTGDLIGQVVGEKYRVLKRLGEGGMGQVYLAQHVMINRRSALKVMHPDMRNDPQAISRFTREANNASSIEHPNVAAIYDYGVTREGLVFLNMEFLDGRPLSAVLEEEGNLSLPRMVTLIGQVAAGLKAAHDLGIVHRDLKPDNIMVLGPVGGPDVAKVVDFGVSKVSAEQEQKLTSSGMVVGTPLYMSPEQLAGEVAAPTSDQFTLAVIAFEMLTGALPFDAATQQQQVAARIVRPAQSLSAVAPSVPWPAELEVVMARALAREPAERYPSVVEFATQLAVTLMAARTSVADARTVMLTGVAQRAVAVAPEAKVVDGAAAGAARASWRVSPVVMTVALVGLIGAGAWGMSHGPWGLLAGAPNEPTRALSDRATAGTGATNGASKPTVGGSEQAGRKVAMVGISGGPTPARGRGSADPATGGPTPTSTDPGATGPKAPVNSPEGAQRNGGSVSPTGTGNGTQGNGNSGAAAPGTTPALTPSTPAAPLYDASTDIARAGTLVKDPENDANLNRVLVLTQQVLSRTIKRSDSTLALMYAGQAHAFLGDKDAACAELGHASRLAAGSALADKLHGILSTLECK